jgi:hypothetical protein
MAQGRQHGRKNTSMRVYGIIATLAMIASIYYVVWVPRKHFLLWVSIALAAIQVFAALMMFVAHVRQTRAERHARYRTDDVQQVLNRLRLPALLPTMATTVRELDFPGQGKWLDLTELRFDIDVTHRSIAIPTDARLTDERTNIFVYLGPTNNLSGRTVVHVLLFADVQPTSGIRGDDWPVECKLHREYSTVAVTQ